MTDAARPHWTFWAIGIIGLLWHLATVMNLLSQIAPGGLDNVPEQYRAIVENRPVWATAALAVAGFGGTIGCALLLLRRRLALPFLWASLAGVIVQMIPALGAAGSMPLGSILLAFVMTLVVIGFLIWYTRRADRLELLR